MLTIVVHKYNPYDGHLGAITYRACAYVEGREDIPAIPITLRPHFDPAARNALGGLGASGDALDREETIAAIARLREASGDEASVVFRRCRDPR